jgi:N-acetylglucosaminyldiphosphoundecaprenol N-acetyl-beta-D-mannosaminyltransferase
LSFPLPDGSSVALGAVIGGVGRIPRCPGPDFFARACERAAADGTSFFLLGGDPDQEFNLPIVLGETYPDLRIVGSHRPPFGDWSPEVDAAIRERVGESGADVVWVGVSAPKQEVWAVANIAELGVPVVCVGAAFDFASGGKSRASHWIRAIGMEWLYRLLSEPKRLWRRYLIGNTVFLADVVRYRFRRPSREDRTTAR